MAKETTKKTVTEKAVKASRYKGKTSGLSVSAYQNQSIARNVREKLTDEQLAKDWHKEFPEAKAFDEATVRTVRSLYNRGAHKNDAPARPIPGYDDSGEALPIRGQRAAEGKATKSTKAVAKATTVRKFKKVTKAA